MGITIAFAFLYGAILYRVTVRYLNYRTRHPAHCIECGYKLQGLTEPRCPECGTRFYPEEAHAAEE